MSVESNVDQNNVYSFLYIDMYKSSDPSLSPSTQLIKIKRLMEILNEESDALRTKYNTDIITYKNFTGDGVVIAFTKLECAIDLAIRISNNLDLGNSGIADDKMKIFVRAGIGYGKAISFSNPFTNKMDLWSHELILSARMMNLGDRGHIIFTPAARSQIPSAEGKDVLTNYELSDGKNLFTPYLREIKWMGQIPVYSFHGSIGSYQFGTKLEPLDKRSLIDKAFDPFVLDTDLSSTPGALQEPLKEYLEEILLDEGKNLHEISKKGGEMSEERVKILYKYFFEKGRKYDGTTTWPLSFFEEIDKSYLTEQKRGREKLNDEEKKDNFRFLIQKKYRLDSDIWSEPLKTKDIIKWHQDNDVNLIRVDPKLALDKRKESDLIRDNELYDTGIWYDKFILEFGKLHTTPNEELYKRSIYFTDSKNNQKYYNNCVQYMNALKGLANEGNSTKIDMNYYDEMIKRRPTPIFNSDFVDAWVPELLDITYHSRMDEVVSNICDKYMHEKGIHNTSDINILDSAGRFGSLCWLLYEKGVTNVMYNEPESYIYEITRKRSNNPFDLLNISWLQLANKFEPLAKKFDIIVGLGSRISCAESYEQVQQYIENLKLILKPGGWLILDLLNLFVTSPKNNKRKHTAPRFNESFFGSNTMKIEKITTKKNNKMILDISFKKQQKKSSSINMIPLKIETLLQLVRDTKLNRIETCEEYISLVTSNLNNSPIYVMVFENTD
jgi:SAM-dependent methyltransferase